MRAATRSASPRLVRILGLGLVLGAWVGAVAAPDAGREGVEEALRRHVAWLAGPELRGRGAWEDRARAAEYVARHLAQAGFLPIPGRTSYFVDHGPDAQVPEARNVCAWWPEPPRTAAEVGDYVLLSAHYDHLGVKDGALYPGADDNASGVAVLLEVARAFVQRERRVLRDRVPRRSVCLVAFDREEQGLVGSRRFVAEPPVPLDRCVLFLTMDQMGRSLADLQPGLLFLMGSEHCAWLDDLVRRVPVAQGVQKPLLGIDFQPPTGYSDYVPFQEARVPFLFVSTGACGHYHQPGDTPELLDYPRMADHVAFVRSLLTDAYGADDVRPTWREPPAPSVEEMRTLRGLVALALPRLEALEAPPAVRLMAANYLSDLDKILDRGTVTPTERTSVRTTARLLFQQAVGLMAGGAGKPR